MNPVEGSESQLPYGLAETIHACRDVLFDETVRVSISPGMTLTAAEVITYQGVLLWVHAVGQGGVPAEAGLVETGEQGEVWVRLTVSQLVEVVWTELYVKFTEKAGQRHLDRLVQKGVLQRAQLGLRRYDRSYFYRLATGEGT